MTVPLWLHTAAWWFAVGVLVAIPITALCAALMNPRTRPVFLAGLIGMALLLLCWFVFECPPAHSATLRWHAPLWQEATTPIGHRCLLSLVPERVALCLVVRQPVAGVARCVAKLPCVRGQSMAWAVPDSLRGAWFDVTAADSAGNKSCAGNVVWVPAP